MMSLHRLFVLAFVIAVAGSLCLLPACEGDNDDDDDNWADGLGDDDTEGTEDDWRFLTDEQGRALVLHGLNTTGDAKGDSGLPMDWFDQEQALRISRDWGFNHVRYLIFWARIEPDTPGVYDEAYLDEVEIRLDWLAEAGVHVVLDMHQDVWGPTLHGGGSDGAPGWATMTDGLPNISFPQWFMNYLSPAVMRAFDNFFDYEKHPGLQDSYRRMWAHVAQRFADHPAVLGYDIMNEAWQGKYLLDSKSFDETVYFDFNQRVIDAIRMADHDGWIFYEPRAFGPNGGRASWIPVLNDPREGAPRLAYYPHLYPIMIDMMGRWDPQRDLAIENWERNRLKESERQKAPVVAGEWSMLNWETLENKYDWMNEALAMFDRSGFGWAYWDHNLGQLIDGDLNETSMADILVRPYPQAVAGEIISYGYDPEAMIFHLHFSEKAGVEGPTRIYLPAARHYPEGWILETSDPDGAWSSQWDEGTQMLYYTADPGQPEHFLRVIPGL